MSCLKVSVNILKSGSFVESPCRSAHDIVNPKTKRIVTERRYEVAAYRPVPVPVKRSNFRLEIPTAAQTRFNLNSK